MHHYDTASSHELCIHVLTSLSPSYMHVCRLNLAMKGQMAALDGIFYLTLVICPLSRILIEDTSR